MKVLKILVFVVIIITKSIAWADGVVITGEETVNLPINTPSQSGSLSYKTIKAYKVKISDKFKDEIRTEIKNLNFIPSDYPSDLNDDDFNVSLGMNNTPVLDQGRYNTCSIFAMTALLDANKNAGDFVSQQCLLELGVYLSQYYYEQSGWEGISSGSVYLDRVKKYGVVDKATCPNKYADKSKSMDHQTYWGYSAGQWSQDLSWQQISHKNLDYIKQALNSGQRVYIEVLLHKNYILGAPINNKPNGLWALPKDSTERAQFINDVLNNINIVGHASVITGYSDKNNYLKLRNSWGSSYGDSGEFYMSYDFYKIMNFSAIVAG